ncbi:M3 family metallopeptidase [Haladaptatus sp. DYF46]|uniref:M3 family oligoendopeptidase n=1 Tax=Haladaptatus sp. DYF46 TaxID=2886041 RepID=UPI001E58DCD9|nr:M3 family metallopeptidase [Haladaptatus sp. DYF46]
MNSIPTRDEIAEEYKWDLSNIFESPDEWSAVLAETESLAESLRERDPRSADGFLDSLTDHETLVRREQRLGLYVRLRCNEDTGDPEREERRDEFRSVSDDVDRTKTAVRRRLQSLSPERVEAFVRENDDLAAFRRYLDDAVRMDRHVRSSDVEEVLTTLNHDTPEEVFRALVNRDFEPPTVDGPDGESVPVTRNRRAKQLTSTDREFRRRVYEAYRGELIASKHAIATAYAEKVKTHSNRTAVRNFDSVRERSFNKQSYPETGLRIDFPTDAHDALLDALRSNLGPHHRYLRVRRDRLGVGELRPWDTNVPLADGEGPEIPYDEAHDHLLDAVEPLGEEYRNRLAGFLHDGRIDVYETEEKRSDIVAYCPSSYDTGAYVLANYDDDVRSLFVLAHELGHAMNTSYLREARRPLYATTPRPVEEVPSLLHELLLARHLIETDDHREHVFDRLLDTVGGNFFGAGMWSAFTHETYGVVEGGGTLTAERLDDIYADLHDEFNAPVVPDEYTASGWLVGSHAREPYHFYQYVLGVVGATVVFDGLTDGTLSPEAYRDFLRTGGKTRAVETFADLGIDVRVADPYDRAASVFEDYVNRSPWA